MFAMHTNNCIPLRSVRAGGICRICKFACQALWSDVCLRRKGTVSVRQSVRPRASRPEGGEDLCQSNGIARHCHNPIGIPKASCEVIDMHVNEVTPQEDK